MQIKPRVTPKDFFLWVGAMAALYASVVSFITLLFEYIDYAYPDALQPYVDPYSGAIRFAIASLLVLFPVFLILMRIIRREIARDPSRAEIWVRRWVLFLTLFVAGITLAADLIILINTFLGGELTTRFVLKVAVVFLVVGAGFLHFLSDLWGYWVRFPGRAKLIGYGAALAIVISIVGGFFIIGSPGEQRNLRMDSQRLSDLQNIQSQVIYYWQQKERLPQNLGELNDPLSWFTVPVDPESGVLYEYRVTKAPYTFELCATFALAGDSIAPGMVRPVMPYGKGEADTNWSHEAGRACFERTIDPELYPVTPKPVR